MTLLQRPSVWMRLQGHLVRASKPLRHILEFLSRFRRFPPPVFFYIVNLCDDDVSPSGMSFRPSVMVAALDDDADF